MAVRTNLTQEDVAQNMLEIALYLAQKEDVNTVDMTVNDLHMHFEAWMEGEGEEHDDKLQESQ